VPAAAALPAGIYLLLRLIAPLQGPSPAGGLQPPAATVWVISQL
jgi:hypothetical protein